LVKIWQIVLVVVVVVAVGVGAFFGGRATGGGGTPTLQAALQRIQNATPAERQQLLQTGGGTGGAGNGAFFGGNGRTGAGGGAVTGSIISSDANSITVKSADGSTKIVLVSPSTTISKFQSASVSDLTTGQNVIVTGTANSDGTVTATRVELGVTLPARQGTAPGNGSAAPGGGPAGSGSTSTSATQ
jgi:hypothetical protein